MRLLQLPEKKEILTLYARFRWMAIFLIISILLYLKYIAEFNVPFFPLLLIVLFGIVYQTFYFFIFPRYKIFSEQITFFTYFSGTIDFIFISLLIHFTGGVESPFILFYLLELIAISIFGFTVLAYLLAIEGTLLYIINCLLEAFFVIPHYRMSDLSGTLFLNFNYIFSMTFALFVTCGLLIYMTSYLTDKLIEKEKKIEELSNAQVDFMHQVMHETKSPLTSIIGYTDVLLKGSLGEISKEQKDPLHIIKRQSKRILNMTEDLLDLARIESGRAIIEKKLTSITELIERTVEEIKPQLDEKKLELIQEITSNLPQVSIDENMILEVLMNLLSNAIKFSKPNGKIFISTQSLGREIQISVRDEGLGIDSEDLPHIFEKFHRASKEAAAVKGTGLGLALSKSIVEAHGGRIWAVSGGRNKGAVFHFTLPL